MAHRSNNARGSLTLGHCRAVPPVRSELARRAAALFDLRIAPAHSTTQPRIEPADLPELPAPGELHLLTGPSGGGKSTRLKTLVSSANQQNITVIDVVRIRLPPVPCVDQFGHSEDLDADLSFAAQQLSRVGLGEAFVFLRLPDELSDGQRWRLRLAIAIAGIMRRHARSAATSATTLLIADEFCAVLDRVSACVVARSLRRTIDRLHRVGVPLCCVVATSHTDLQPALLADKVVWCETEGDDPSENQRDD